MIFFRPAAFFLFTPPGACDRLPIVFNILNQR